MPGQAVSYMIGNIGIQRARKNRQKELGDKFDLKAFHRQVLTCLGPIEMLEECIKEEENLPFSASFYSDLQTKQKSFYSDLQPEQSFPSFTRSENWLHLNGYLE